MTVWMGLAEMKWLVHLLRYVSKDAPLSYIKMLVLYALQLLHTASLVCQDWHKFSSQGYSLDTSTSTTDYQQKNKQKGMSAMLPA